MPEFDPYHKWLGIAPDEQRLNHYRVLGVRLFESDPDVIANAADQRMAHIRTFQGGRHSDLSQKILNEIASARVCLLNEAKKAEYDEQLRQQLASSTPLLQPPAVPVSPPSTIGGPPPLEQRRPGPVRRKQRSLHVPIVFAASAIICGTIIAVLVATKPKDTDVPNPAAPPTAQSVENHSADPAKKAAPSVPVKTPKKDPVAPVSLQAKPDDKKPVVAIQPVTPPPPPVKKPEPKPIEPPEKPPVVVAPPAPSLDEIEQRVKTGLASANQPAEFAAVTDDALQLADQAIVEGNQDVAKRAAAMALAAARKANVATSVNAATLRLIELNGPITDALKAKAQQRLKAKPAR